MKRVYYLTRIFAGVLCMILCVVCMPGFNASAEETNTVNITQNGKTTVSVSTEPSRALGLIDGDNKVTAVYPNENRVGSWGYWSAGAQTATIDLGANYNLTQLKLYLGTNSGSQLPEKFILYSSLDGNTFEKFCESESDSINNNVCTADIQKVLAARYVKLEIPAAPAARAICVREIEIYGTFNSYVTTNLTQNGKTTVTNTSINTPRAGGLIDGNNTITAEYPNADGVGSWGYYADGAQTATIDLGANCNLAQLILYLGTNSGSQRPEGFVLYSSLDGQDFTQFYASGSVNDKSYTVKLEETVTARYVKLEIPAASEKRAICVREIEIYGTSEELDGVFRCLQTENGYIFKNGAPITNSAVVIATTKEANTMTDAKIIPVNVNGFGGSETIDIDQKYNSVYVWYSLSNMVPMNIQGQ